MTLLFNETHPIPVHAIMAMIALYFFALIVTGFFTLMPGRVMHQILISH